VPRDHYNRLAAAAGLPQVEGVVAPPPARREQVQPSESRRLLRWGAVGCGGLILFSVLLFFGVVHLIKSSDAYAMAEGFLLENEEVQRRLGPGLKGDSIPLGTLSTSGGGSGEAVFKIDLKGDGGEGFGAIELSREAGQWRIEQAWLYESGALAGLDLLNPSAPSGASGAASAHDPVDALRAAVSADPDDFEAHRRLDLALARQGRFDEVVAVWNRYLLTHEDDGRAWLERGGARYHMGQRQKAGEDAQRACELGVTEACQRAAQMR
jgi:tetratricopeptide (TPR) repeat protein